MTDGPFSRPVGLFVRVGRQSLAPRGARPPSRPGPARLETSRSAGERPAVDRPFESLNALPHAFAEMIDVPGLRPDLVATTDSSIRLGASIPASAF